MLELHCATSNRHKLAEFRRASEGVISVRGCPALDCPETGETFEDNALQKALCYAAQCEAEWLFADDSGLCVDALDGDPGIRSARFAGEGATDRANNDLLLKLLRDVAREERTARFVCAIALVHRGKHMATFRGEVEGLILRRHSGEGGFGYDPLFHFPPLGKSFGLVTPAAKWQHSHRGKAYRSLVGWMSQRA